MVDWGDLACLQGRGRPPWCGGGWTWRPGPGIELSDFIMNQKDSGNQNDGCDCQTNPVIYQGF